MKTYAVAWVHPNRKLSTRVDTDGHNNPTWNDKFVFRVDDEFLRADTSAVMVEIYALHWFKDVHVGTVRVLVGNLIPPPTRPNHHHHHNHLGMRFVALQVRRQSGRPQGILNLGVALLDSSMRSMPLYTQIGTSAVGYRHLMGEEDVHGNQHNLNNNSNNNGQPIVIKPILRKSRSERSERKLMFDDDLSIKDSAINGSELSEARAKGKKGTRSKASSLINGSEIAKRKKKGTRSKASSLVNGSEVRTHVRKKSSSIIGLELGSLMKKKDGDAKPDPVTNVSSEPAADASKNEKSIPKNNEPPKTEKPITKNIAPPPPPPEIEEPVSKHHTEPPEVEKPVSKHIEPPKIEKPISKNNVSSEAMVNGPLPREKGTVEKPLPKLNGLDFGTSPKVKTLVNRYEYGITPRSNFRSNPWAEFDVGPSPSEVAAAVAAEGRYPLDEGESSVLDGWSIDDQSVEGLRSKLERWRTELPPVYDRGDYGSFRSTGHIRRHTDGGGGLFSCFGNIFGFECSCICGKPGETGAVAGPSASVRKKGGSERVLSPALDRRVYI